MSKIRKYQNPPKVKISLHTTTVNTPDKRSVDKPLTENLNINAINKMNILKTHTVFQYPCQMYVDFRITEIHVGIIMLFKLFSHNIS